MMQENVAVTLRPTELPDLQILFEIQQDEEAIWQAAFTPKDHTDKEAFIKKFTRILQDPSINNQTIIVNGSVVGSLAKFIMEGDAEITYWVKKEYWGKGITTAALKNFLAIEHTRPLNARAAFDNTGSQRVLEKCGFIKTGTDSGFANARQKEIEEFIYRFG